jgi:hypothetical protein
MLVPFQLFSKSFWRPARAAGRLSQAIPIPIESERHFRMGEIRATGTKTGKAGCGARLALPQRLLRAAHAANDR